MLKAICTAAHDLLTGFAAWKEARRKRKAENRYQEGYRAGMQILRNREMTPEALYQCTEEAKDFGHFTEFDVGVRSAMFDYERSGAASLNTSTLH